MHVVQQFNIVIGWKTFPEKTLLYHFHAEKVQILQNTNLESKPAPFKDRDFFLALDREFSRTWQWQSLSFFLCNSSTADPPCRLNLVSWYCASGAPCFDETNWQVQAFYIFMDLACWRLGPSEISQMRGDDARKEMEDGGRDRKKWEKKGKWGCLFDEGGEPPPVLYITTSGSKILTKNFPPTFFRVVILIWGQDSHQTLSRYQSPPRFQSGQDYQPDMCSPVWRFEFNWWRWASDWPKIRCTNCVERIFRRGKKL